MNPLVPREVYSANIKKEHIPILEQFCFEDIDFYPDSVRNDPDLAHYCLRIGYAFMANIERQINSSDTINSAENLGDHGFSWFIDCQEIEKIESPVLVCAGAGTNISFELEIAQRFPHSRIYLLDPSPQSVNYLKGIELPSNITFLEVGLAGISGELVFTKPNVEGLGSLSAKAIVRGNETIRLRVTSLNDLMKTHHIVKIDYLKFDIEGCEHEVIESLQLQELLPPQIAFELDMPVPIWKCTKTLRKAMALGYQIVAIEKLNVFMRLGHHGVSSDG